MATAKRSPSIGGNRPRGLLVPPKEVRDNFAVWRRQLAILDKGALETPWNV